MVASVNFVQLWADFATSGLLSDGSITTAFTPTILRTAITPSAPIAHQTHLITDVGIWVTLFAVGDNRRTGISRTRDTIFSAILHDTIFRKMCGRETRVRTLRPGSEISVGTRNFTGTVIARDLFVIPFTSTVPIILNTSSVRLEAQTTR
jgi:hypothetical protein